MRSLHFFILPKQISQYKPFQDWADREGGMNYSRRLGATGKSWEKWETQSMTLLAGSQEPPACPYDERSVRKGWNNSIRILFLWINVELYDLEK
jgi:hypothetical protein